MVYFDEEKFLKFWNQIYLFFLRLVFPEKFLPNPRLKKIIYIFFSKLILLLGGSDGKAPVCNAKDLSSIPGSRISPGEGNGSPLQWS